MPKTKLLRMSSLRVKQSFIDIPLQRVSIDHKIDAFMAQHPETQLSSKEIKTVLAMFKQWRARGRRGRPTRYEFSRKVLSYIADRMFWSNFPDSENVIELLDLIMDLDKHLFLIMCPRAGNSANYSNADVDHLVYFLNHNYKQKHLFNGYRISSLLFFDSIRWLNPLQWAVFRNDVLLLRQLLRYGAVLSYGKNPWSEFPWNPEAHLVLFKFYYLLVSNVDRIVQLNPMLLPIETLTLSPEEYQKYSNLVSCCSLLLKDAPQWPLSDVNILLPRGSPWKDNYSEFIRVFSRNVVSGFQKHFNTPMDLKEICRRVIRTNLNENWQLPHGISQLPIPKRLRLYLDLCD